MKVVLWRFAHDCLPSGAQLQRRHIPDSASCCFCGRLESVEHATLFVLVFKRSGTRSKCGLASNSVGPPSETQNNSSLISSQDLQTKMPRLWLCLCGIFGKLIMSRVTRLIFLSLAIRLRKFVHTLILTTRNITCLK